MVLLGYCILSLVPFSNYPSFRIYQVYIMDATGILSGDPISARS
jgi:hypothetical protein